MAVLFVTAPLLILAKLVAAQHWLHIPLGLTKLDQGNYKRKYRQRMAMLVAGTTFWILIIRAIS